MKILVTGSAGFIGFHLTRKLLQEGNEVVGLDNINDYYDRNLKFARLTELGITRENIFANKFTKSKLYQKHKFIKIPLEDSKGIAMLFESEKFDIVVNLAAQAGVRYSIVNPEVYIKSNIIGFYNLLEASRRYPVKHFIFASSSSVYGNNDQVPFKEDAVADTPISLYAATKKSGELMAYTYSSLYDIPLTGLRFFTVYGPWGRPDMALSLFTDSIIKETTIKVFNNGNLSRDFTYIDDTVQGIGLVINRVPIQKKEEPPYRILNIGNQKPIRLMAFINEIERALRKKAIIEYKPMQPGDVYKTWADISKLVDLTGFEPKTSIKEGVSAFVGWHQNFIKLKE